MLRLGRFLRRVRKLCASRRDCFNDLITFDPSPKRRLHKERTPWQLSYPAKFICDVELSTRTVLVPRSGDCIVEPVLREAVRPRVNVGMEAVVHIVDADCARDEGWRYPELGRDRLGRKEHLPRLRSAPRGNEHLDATRGVFCGQLSQVGNQVGLRTFDVQRRSIRTAWPLLFARKKQSPHDRGQQVRESAPRHKEPRYATQTYTLPGEIHG